MGDGTVVEFVGLPGAGKSFLATKVTTRLAELGIDVHNSYSQITSERRLLVRAGRRLAITIPFLIRRPGFAFQAGRSLVKVGPGLGAFWRLLMNWVTVQALVESGHSRAGVTILDQGTYQLMWSIGARYGSAAVGECAAVAGSSRARDLIVIVQVSNEVAVDRLASRHGGRGVSDLFPTDGEEVVAAVVETLTAESPGLPGIVTVRNDPGSSVDEALDVVTDEIQNRGRR